jgi:hypothetical protein
VSYQPVEPGKYQVHVLLRHKLYPLYYEHIQQSPFRLEVEAGTDASKTIGKKIFPIKIIFPPTNSNKIIFPSPPAQQILIFYLAFGPGLEDKVTDQLPTHFTIQSKDRNGNDMKNGGDPFEVSVQGPNGEVPATIKDNSTTSLPYIYLSSRRRHIHC